MLIKQSLSLKISALVDICVTFMVLLMFLSLLDTKSSYIGFGPSDDFYVVTIQVNTWAKYIGVLVMIAVIKISTTFSMDFAYPIIHFNVYDPNKKNVRDFKRWELWTMTNMVFASGSIRSVFMMVITVSRIDIAFFGVLVSELTCIIVVGILLKKKNFLNQKTTTLVDTSESDGEIDVNDDFELEPMNQDSTV